MKLIRAMSVLALFLAEFTYAQSVTFQHIVFIVQENRTPDNLFGSNPTFEPGVDIATSGLNSLGQTIPLAALPLANCYEVIHGHNQFVKQYDKGKMDGADKNPIVPSTGCTVPSNPQFKYVDNSTGTVQPYFDLAMSYGWANRMFQTNQGPSFPAHQFLISGTSAPTTTSTLFASDNSAPAGPVGCLAAANVTVPLLNSTGQIAGYQYPCFEHPTLTDLLDAAKKPISWAYYASTASSIVTAPNAINHMCVPETVNGKLTCTAAEWTNHVAIPQTKVLGDIQNCRLRSVVWVTPDGPESDLGGGNSGLGPSWVASIVNEIGNSTCGYWENTAILILWDDWGGWYDHVPPFLVGGQPNGWGTSYVYGFRVPMIVVSAYTPQGYVDNSDHDFGSLLQFVETNFGGLGLIGPGDYADAYSDNLSAFFTLTSPRVFAPIPAVQGATYFLNYKFKPNPEGPDPDGDED
jgi:phospholipase C